MRKRSGSRSSASPATCCLSSPRKTGPGRAGLWQALQPGASARGHLPAAVEAPTGWPMSAREIRDRSRSESDHWRGTPGRRRGRDIVVQGSGTAGCEAGRAEANARSDSALSHPNPVAIEMRCITPPRSARRGVPPNAAPNSTNALVIAVAEPAEYEAQRYSPRCPENVAQVRAAIGIPAKIGIAHRLCSLPSGVGATDGARPASS